MPKPALTPSAEQIESARKLMSGAQIRSIRLTRGHIAHMPSRPPQGEALQVDMTAKPDAHLTPQGELRVVVEFAAAARRRPGSHCEIQVGATFELLYHIPGEFRPKKAELEGFAHTNAMLNSFPYWREYVQSSVARMNLPPLLLPLFRITPPLAQAGKAASGKPRARKTPKS